jgi:hypothetical protein
MGEPVGISPGQNDTVTKITVCQKDEKMKKNTVSKDLAERVAGLTVLDIRKNAVELPSLWSDRRIVLTFFRHFG